MMPKLFKTAFSSFVSFLRRRETPELVETQPPRRISANRIHVFHGDFTSELEATDYCLTPLGHNQPEPLTRDLPNAIIDTSEVEIVFGVQRISAAIPMITPHPDGLRHQFRTSNTLILISETAFGGLPFTLNDTPALRYAGMFEIT